MEMSALYACLTRPSQVLLQEEIGLRFRREDCSVNPIKSVCVSEVNIRTKAGRIVICLLLHIADLGL